MKDPYEVLGVSRTASDSEIKKAYHELVKKYHPDNYADNPLADLASEKMKEINEAYDSITKARSAGQGGSYQQSGSYRQTDAYSAYQQTGYGRSNPQYSQIRGYINYNQLDQAEAMLNGISNRDAEWYFLMGQVSYRRGWLDQARQHFQTAVAMNPNNGEYQQSLRTVSGGYTPFRQTNYQRSDMDTACDICNTLLCLNCLCGGGCR